MDIKTKEMVDLLSLLKKNEGKSSFAHEMKTTRGRFIDLLNQADGRGFIEGGSFNKLGRNRNTTATFTDDVKLTPKGEEFMLDNWEVL